MSGLAPLSISSEKEALVAYLLQQREGLKNAAYGLTPDQLRARSSQSALSVGGLLRHAALTEASWINIMRGGSRSAEEAYADTFALTEADTTETLAAELDRVGAETEAAIGEVDDLDTRFPLPDAPWFPKDQGGASARWILFHVIEELARHAGHADIIREHVDGATMYELMAAAEGWPETDWMKPWRPAERDA